MIQFLVHDRKDTVGVAVVDIKGGELVKGITLDDHTPFEIRTQMDIPFGHKLALRTLEVGDSITKYGHDIGKVVSRIKIGDHVHTHNLKTKRW